MAPTATPKRASPLRPTTVPQADLEVSAERRRSDVYIGGGDHGPVAATHVVMTDDLPESLDVLEASGSHGEVHVYGRLVQAVVASMAHGERVVSHTR